MKPPSQFSALGAVRRRRWLEQGAGWLAFAAALAQSVLDVVWRGVLGAGRAPSLEGLAMWVALGGVLVWAIEQNRARGRLDEAQGASSEVRVDAEHISILGRWSARIPRDAIVNGAVVRRSIWPDVELDLSGAETVVIRMRTVAEADALLDSLGLGAERRRYRHMGPASDLRPGLGFTATCLLIGAAEAALVPVGGGASGLGAAALWFALAAVVTTVLVAGTAPSQVIVGIDGIVVEGLLRRRRIIPFADLRAVAVSERGLELTRVDGRIERVRVRIGTSVDAEALERRIRGAMAAREGGALDLDAWVERLERQGRTLPEWREHLATLVSGGAAAYRAVKLTPEDAEAILARGDLAAEQRLAAAMALRAAMGESATPRIRVAAEACASPKLRVALTRMAEGEEDDAALAEALAEEEATRVA